MKDVKKPIHHSLITSVTRITPKTPNILLALYGVAKVLH